jgi:hypothetical protein
MQSSFFWLAAWFEVSGIIQLQATPPLLDQKTFLTLLLLLFSSYLGVITTHMHGHTASREITSGKRT